MEIDKISFKNDQAWIVIKSENGSYLGTWHVVDKALVENLRKTNYIGLKFIEQRGKKSADI